MSADSAPRALESLIALDQDLRRSLDLGGQPPVATFAEALVMSDKTISVALAARSAPDTATAIARGKLIAAVLDARGDVRNLMLKARSRRIRALTRAITRIRGATSIDALIRQTCAELTGSLEFQRASYSVIDLPDNTVRDLYTLHDPPRDHRAWPLTGAERECIAAARPILVSSVRTPRLPPSTPEMKPGAELLGEEDYVVAPVVTRTEVRALIRAARRRPWSVDSADLQLIGIIASAFSVVYEREVQADRARRRRETVLAAIAQLAADVDSFAGADVDWGLDGISALSPTPASPISTALCESLTPREAEVLGLIVSGASNNEIAEQLVITVETVKSHVKQVLRKLGAVNRAEAISLYLGEQRRTRKT